MMSFDYSPMRRLYFFFFQAEDGIRDYKVTGVQTCALPICRGQDDLLVARIRDDVVDDLAQEVGAVELPLLSGSIPTIKKGPFPGADIEIGRASCRERV